MAYADLRGIGAQAATIPGVMSYQGAYNTFRSYVFGDVVYEAPLNYICIASSGAQGFLPSTSPTKWSVMGGGGGGGALTAVSSAPGAGVASATVGGIATLSSALVAGTNISLVADPVLPTLTAGVNITTNLNMNSLQITQANNIGFDTGTPATLDGCKEVKAPIGGNLNLNCDGGGSILFTTNSGIRGSCDFAGNWGFATFPSVAGTPTSGNQLTNKTYVDSKLFSPAVCSAISTITQTVSAANAPTVIQHGQLDVNIGGFALNAGNIVIPTTGTYRVFTSIQLDKSGGGVSPCDFWVAVNGLDIPNSASQVVVNGQTGETLATVEIILQLNATNQIGVVFASSDNTMAATYFGAQTNPPGPYTRPAVPSIITNIQRIA